MVSKESDTREPTASQGTVESEYSEPQTEDTIDIGHILSKIWQRRGVVFAVVLVGMLLGMATSMIVYYRSNFANFVEYYVALEGINNSRYPNGTEFSPQDLVSPAVINRLADEVGIDDRTELREAISVGFNNPAAEGIAEKYRERLSTRGLSAAEIDEINQQYAEELARANSSSLRLTIYPAPLGINTNLARQILIRIPVIWSNVYTSSFRILDDHRLHSIKLDLSEQVATAIGSINANKKLDSLKGGLAVLVSDNRLSALQASDGSTAAELLRLAQDFDEIYLSPILASRLSKDDFLTRFYINNFRFKIGEIDTELETINTTVNDLRSIMDSQQSVAAADGSNDTISTVDIDGSAFEGIVELANRASLTDYLTKLLEKRQALVRERSELNTRILRASSDIEITQGFIDQAEAILKGYFGTYNELVSRAREIVRAESIELFRPTNDPDLHEQNHWLITALVMAFALFVSLALALTIAVLLPTREQSLES